MLQTLIPSALLAAAGTAAASEIFLFEYENYRGRRFPAAVSSTVRALLVSVGQPTAPPRIAPARGPALGRGHIPRANNHLPLTLHDYAA